MYYLHSSRLIDNAEAVQRRAMEAFEGISSLSAKLESGTMIFRQLHWTNTIAEPVTNAAISMQGECERNTFIQSI